MVLYALTTGHKIGLGAMAGAFIVLALVAALVVPRLRPDFPGRGLRPFLLAALTLTVGMLLAVVILGREPKEVVGGLAHRAHDDDDIVALPPGAYDVVRDRLHAVGVGDGRTTELLDEETHWSPRS